MKTNETQWDMICYYHEDQISGQSSRVTIMLNSRGCHVWNGDVTGDLGACSSVQSPIVPLQGTKEGLSHQPSDLCLKLRPMVSTPDFIQLRGEKPGNFPFFRAVSVPGHVGLVAVQNGQ